MAGRANPDARSLRGALRALRERLARWLRDPRPPATSPYRLAAPDHPSRAGRVDRALAAAREAWRADRDLDDASAPLRDALRAIRAMGSPTVVRVIGWSSLGGGGLAALCVGLMRCARFAAPRVSTGWTHVLAVPFGLFVGVCAGVCFLALGVAALTAAGCTLGAVGSLAWGLGATLGRALHARRRARVAAAQRTFWRVLRRAP